jgi:hypothetical protein
VSATCPLVFDVIVGRYVEAGFTYESRLFKLILRAVYPSARVGGRFLDGKLLQRYTQVINNRLSHSLVFYRN